MKNIFESVGDYNDFIFNIFQMLFSNRFCKPQLQFQKSHTYCNDFQNKD